MNNKIQPYALYTDNYQKYGKESPVNVWEADPVQCAIDGPDGVNKLFTCSRNATRVPLGMNRAFMAQRCAKNWDGYCDLFGRQEFNSDYTRKNFNLFIRDTLSKMFCQNDTSIPGAQCVERCEMYNPMSSNSVEVCQTQGDLVFRANNYRWSLSTTYPQTGELDVAEPIRFTKCPKICNLVSADKLTDANIPLNIALDQGIATDLIMNLCDNIVSQGMQVSVTNQRLKNFLQSYVQDGTVKVGYASLGAGPYVTSRPVAMPAVNSTIPPDTALVVNDNYGNVGPRMIPATAETVQSEPAAPEMAEEPAATSEAFGYFDMGESEDSDNSKNCMIGLALFFIALYCIKKYQEK